LESFLPDLPDEEIREGDKKIPSLTPCMQMLPKNADGAIEKSLQFLRSQELKSAGTQRLLCPDSTCPQKR
jgi:hypothetical protein